MQGLKRLLQAGLVALCVFSFYACKDNPLTDKHGDKSCAIKCETMFGSNLPNVAFNGCIESCDCKMTSTTTYSCD